METSKLTEVGVLLHFDDVEWCMPLLCPYRAMTAETSINCSALSKKADVRRHIGGNEKLDAHMPSAHFKVYGIPVTDSTSNLRRIYLAEESVGLRVVPNTMFLEMCNFLQNGF